MGLCAGSIFSVVGNTEVLETLRGRGLWESFFVLLRSVNYFRQEGYLLLKEQAGISPCCLPV